MEGMKQQARATVPGLAREQIKDRERGELQSQEMISAVSGRGVFFGSRDRPPGRLRPGRPFRVQIKIQLAV